VDGGDTTELGDMVPLGLGRGAVARSSPLPPSLLLLFSPFCFLFFSVGWV